MDLTALPWSTITPTGALIMLLAYLLRSVASGTWVSQRELDAMTSDRDWWRDTAEKRSAANDIRASAFEETLENTRIIRDIVKALPPMKRTRHRADAEAFLREITG